MKTCAVFKCVNDSYKRPDLTFFGLPKHTSVREEWLEILGVKNSHFSNIFVCEQHFRDKDIREGKRELKHHSVPVLQLGKGHVDPIDSEDEFMAYGSDSSPEVLEVKYSLPPKIIKTEQELIESHNIKQEPNPDGETETGRRPSRRAAIVAAKKISNTVRNYNLKEDPDFEADISVTPKPLVKTEKAQKRKKTPTPPPPSPPPTPPPPEPPIEIGLDMECDDEILSETQAEILSQAQTHYNIVMKGLRELVQCNVKVIQTDAYGRVLLNPPPLSFQTIPVKNTPVSSPKPSQTNKVVIRTEAPRIVPIALSVANSQPSIIII